MPPVIADVPGTEESLASEFKRYTKKEAPKVAGGIKVGTRRLVVVTGLQSEAGKKLKRAMNSISFGQIESG